MKGYRSLHTFFANKTFMSFFKLNRGRYFGVTNENDQAMFRRVFDIELTKKMLKEYEKVNEHLKPTNIG